MKVIVAGSRHFNDADIIYSVIKKSPWAITELVHGCARGVDTTAGQWAKENSIPVKEFPADWSQFGKAAGPIRNTQMAEYSDALIAIMFDGSRGTKNMIQTALNKNLQIFVVNMDGIKTIGE